MSFYDEASWLLIPEGIEEDIVFAQKPTNGNGDLTFTRASDATRTNSAGVIERTPWNLVTFSEDFSNVAWVKSNATISTNSTTAPNGTLTADTLNVTANIYSGVNQSFANLNGSYTSSIYAKKGTKNWLYFIGVSGNALRAAWFNLDTGAVGTVNAGVTATIENVGNGWYRCTAADTRTGTGYFQIGLSDANGSQTPASSGTAFIWGAQLVEGTDAKPYFATTNRQDVPRLDYRNADGTVSTCPRLLLEPQRTNSIRNSTMVGAVAGSPGTLPTNWTPLANALTQTVVGLGTENGLQYIDLRYNGISTNIQQTIAVEGLLNIAATTGQTWSFSTYVKLISGTFNSLQLQLTERSSGGGFVTVNAQTISPTSSLNRFAFTQTLNGGATTIAVQPNYRIGLTIGATYDFTIRIAAPQMELGAYATTFIPTTTAAVTRIIDNFTRNNVYTNGLVSPAGGTWFVDLDNSPYTRDASAIGLFLSSSTSGIGAGTAYTLGISNSGTPSARANIYKRQLGTLQILHNSTSQQFKMAIKWNGSTADVFLNATKIISATVFTGTELEFLNTSNTDTPKIINQMALFPTPLTDDQCIQLTT